MGNETDDVTTKTITDIVMGDIVEKTVHQLKPQRIEAPLPKIPKISCQIGNYAKKLDIVQLRVHLDQLQFGGTSMILMSITTTLKDVAQILNIRPKCLGKRLRKPFLFPYYITMSIGDNRKHYRATLQLLSDDPINTVCSSLISK